MRLVLALLAMASTTATHAQSASALLTLDAALARALERNAVVLSATADQQVAAARLRSARAWSNPTLHLETENVLGEGEFADFNAAETTVSLAQELPLGGQRGAAQRAARVGQAVAQAGAELARLDVRRDVTIAYAEVIAADRLAEITRQRARIAAETQRAVERRLSAGLESELASSRITVEASGLQAAARRAAAEATAARRFLAEQWRADSVTETLDGAWFDRAPAVAAASLAPDAHPRVRQAQLAADRARAQLDGARAQRFQAIEATVGTRRFKDQASDSNQAFVLGVSVPLPLWDRNRAGIAEARAELLRAEIEAEQVARAVAAEQAAAIAELQAAALEVQALTTALPAAESAARLSQQGYDAGHLSLLERLSAERALSDSREQLERARLAMHRARATVDSLSAQGP
ncbi:MAG TPA: TolC family protein [Steroidobacteraceae bacterium]|nr:TolC family protein [Steroidobacteraceae bacterium]HRX88063.1 TolC family protein [Steroidobacteraceae bacterium]